MQIALLCSILFVFASPSVTGYEETPIQPRYGSTSKCYSNGCRWPGSCPVPPGGYCKKERGECSCVL